MTANIDILAEIELGSFDKSQRVWGGRKCELF